MSELIVTRMDTIARVDPAERLPVWPGRGRYYEWCPSFKWCLDRRRYCLVLGDPATRRYVYEVDLERCLTAAAVLDWLSQMNIKVWGTARVIGGLLQALDAVLHLQSSLCGSAMSGSGMGRSLTRAQVKKFVRRGGGV